MGSESSLSQSTLSLPTCRISSSVQQLMELAYNTMEEAKTSTKFWYCCLFPHLEMKLKIILVRR